MSTILLSIKPEYVRCIFNGTKKYEFRKKLPKNTIKKIVVYSTFPDKAVVGEVNVKNTLSMTPSKLWDLTKNEAGISHEKFMEYFKGCTKAYAYELGKCVEFKERRSIKDYGFKQAPQSFVYLKECPFCQSVMYSHNSKYYNSKSEEHIIPMSLGNETFTINKGWICDKCNNYFAREIEKPFLDNEIIKKLRTFHSVPSRKGHIPPMKIYISKEQGFMEFDHKRNCAFLGLSETAINKVINDNPDTILFDGINNIDSLYENYDVSRFLVKIFAESCLYYTIENIVDKNNVHLILDKKMTELCKYVRFGDRNKKIYKYSVKVNKTITPFSDDDFIATIELLFNKERQQLEGMKLSLYELEFCLMI